jgi:hypothetical protein
MPNGTMKSLKWILGISLSALLTGAVALGGWNLSKTASIPERYATKVEMKEAADHAEKDRDKIRQEFSDKMEDMNREQRYIRQAVDDIKNILINNHE